MNEGKVTDNNLLTLNPVKRIIYKIFRTRRFIKYALAIADFIGAVFFAFFFRWLLPPLAEPNYMLQVWLLMLVIAWFATSNSDRNFVSDSYLIYVRVCRVTFLAALAYLLFFVVLRLNYSLKYLLLVSVTWCSYAIIYRWQMRKYSPPAKALAFEQLPDTVLEYNKIEWHIAQDPKDVDLNYYDFLLINFEKEYPPDWQKLFAHAHIARMPIVSLPQVLEHLTGKISVEYLRDFWIENTFYVNSYYLKFKRCADLVIVLLLLPLLIPISLLVSLLILIAMGRPILFWQERIGMDNKPFRIAKYRTMVRDAEEQGAAFAEKKDLRITKLGRILRKLRLDELPQFYNVLKGEMSIIGPRPEQKVFVDEFMEKIPVYHVRHWVRPGITGWAQIKQGYADDEETTLEKLRYDLFYLKNVTIWMDMLVFFRTLLIILTCFGSR